MANEAANAGGQGNTQTPAAATGKAGEAASTGAAATGNEGKTPEQIAAEAAAATAGDGGNKQGGKAGENVADPPKAPEKYDLKLPEGDLAVYADQSTLDRIAAIAKQNGWTNEEAQSQVNEYAAAYKAQADEFKVALEADAEYGGEKLANTQKLAKAVLDKVRPANTPRGKALRRILDASGYGNHIEIVSFLADLGKMTGEDTGIVGESGSGGGAKKSPAEVLYGS